MVFPPVWTNVSNQTDPWARELPVSLGKGLGVGEAGFYLVSISLKSAKVTERVCVNLLSRLAWPDTYPSMLYVSFGYT